MLSPILHPASGLWMLGKIEEHTAKPLSREEIEQHIAGFNLLRAREKSMMKLAEHIEAATVDKARLDHLEKLIQHCPHAEFYFSDDEANEKPMGFSIEVDGCEPSSVAAPTLREAIDKDIEAHTELPRA